MSKRHPFALLGVFAVTLLVGCSVAGPRQSPLPKDGPTMVDIYKRHMEEEGVTLTPRDRLPNRGVNDDGDGAYFRRVTTDPGLNQFQRLPNPDLEMHVFPHLANGKYPVPGYVTVFPMYESVQYALPGEVAPRQFEVSPSTPAFRGMPVESTGGQTLQLVSKMNPKWYRVAVDFRDDFAKECDASIDDRSLVELISSSESDGNLHDLQRRLIAFEQGDKQYGAQRKKLACRDVSRALTDRHLATR